MENNRRFTSSVSPRTGSLSERKGAISSGVSSRGSHSSDSGEDLLYLHPHPIPGSPAERPTPTPDDWLEAWREKFEQGTLTQAHFREQWRIWVPKVYGPRMVSKKRISRSESMEKTGLEWGGDEDEAQKILYEPFEKFICGGDPEEVLQKLKEKEGPRQVCGRVFRMGEPTYSCRECGVDSTCVLCVHCFKVSPHRHHKYKMGTSGGGGCCDCGDLEAWKSEPYCQEHAPPSSLPDCDNEDATNEASMEEGEANQEEGACAMLAPDIERRAKIAFSAALQYAFHLLTLEHAPGLPSDLRRRECCQEAEGWANDGSGFEGGPENGDGGDLYCTVLHNDETHTYEQFINTVARVVKCPHREAIQFVTAIDLEGRAVVKCAKFNVCSGERSEIERFTSRQGGHPLKVLVMHSHVVAHQTFALRLLARMRHLLSQSKVLRAVFSQVVHQGDSTELSILEGILRRDCYLWKSARSHWHYLFITGMLMEYSSKKLFAQVFTKHYGNVLKDFIRDDHDHSFSVASLSVQIYSVPSLARSLIAHSDVLYPLINTFLSECAPKCNSEGKLEFERNAPSATFKRAQYILYDLRYLLTPVPTSWTDPLRKGFLQGYSLLLNLLTMLQGMDSVTRQTGQHIEYEPDWESAFNLHLKLAHVVALFIDWCSTDRVVLIKAYRATLKKLQEAQNIGSVNAGDGENKAVIVGEAVEVGEHSAACIKYDVASKPVSVHLPLSRLLAGLHLHLHKYGLSFDSPEFHPERFVLHSKPTPVEIMEPVLRCQVMIAQVHAGMWRRNGYFLLNQLYFYHNVKFRSEMLDRDIVLLQMAASLLESNEFIIHLLNRFNLVSWAHQDFEITSLRNSEEDTTRQTISLVEEMLGLLITICGERWTVGVGEGVTPRAVVRREVVQQLCVRPMAHSELGRALPLEDGGAPSSIPSTSCLDDVLQEVAVFRSASVMSQSSQGESATPNTGPRDRGVYELKPALADEYDVFFYHYTREEMSKSEEVQRKRRKTQGKLECCPPPAPPTLSPPFAMLANLLQCDVMLHIMATVLQRSADLRARSFSETQLHKTLHLIGYALHEEERSRKRAKEAEAKQALLGEGERDAMSEVGDAVAGFFCFTERAERRGILKLIEKLVSSQRVEAHRDMLLWTIEKFNEVAALRNQYSPGGSDSGNASAADSTESSREVAGVLKRREGEDEASKEEKERRSKLAAMKRAKIMEQMVAMQKSFLKEHAQLFEETNSEKNTESEMELVEMEGTTHTGDPVAFGPRQTPPVGFQKRYTCILCQEEEDVVRGNNRALVLSAFVQRSTVLCLEREHVPPSLSEQTAMQQQKEPNVGPFSFTGSVRKIRRKSPMEKVGGKEDDTKDVRGSSSSHMEDLEEELEEEVCAGEFCLGWNLGPAPHTSTCGHVMHAHCWQKYYDSVLTRENRRPYRFRQPASFDVENKEFLCPLCECLSNTVLPLVPPQLRTRNFNSSPTEERLPFGVWVKGLLYTLHQSKERDEGWNADVNAGSSLSSRRSHSRIPVPSNSNLGSSPTQSSALGPAAAAIRRHRVSHSSGSSTSSQFSSDTDIYMEYQTCPILKVAEELGSKHGPEFAKLFQQSGSDDSENMDDEEDDSKIVKKERAEAVTPLSNTLCEMVLLFCQTTYEVGLDTEPELGDDMIPMLAWRSTSYTIHALEWLLRSSELPYSTPRSLLGHLSSRQRDCLRGLIQLASSIETVWRKPQILSCHAVRLLFFLFHDSIMLESGQKSQEPWTHNVSLLEWDSFGILIPLLMTVRGMYSGSDTDEPPAVNGSSLRDLYILRLVFLSHITKIILTADFDSLREEPMEVTGASFVQSSGGPVWSDNASLYAGVEGFQKFVGAVREAAGLDPTPIMEINPRTLWRKVANDSVAFLRCSGLLAHFLSGIPPSSALETPGGATFHALCDYLGLSPSHSTPASPETLGLDGSCDVSEQLALGWAHNSRTRQLLRQNALKPLELRKGPASIKQPIGVNQLVSLPDDYSELINKASLFSCPNSDREASRNPTLCLVCGEILCSQSYCCQTHINKILVGACNFHAHHCGAGVGLFMRVRECEVLIISTPLKGCLLLAPYLDCYGESDPGLRRGNPLWLCHERYARLHALWLSHALPEEVARALDSSSSPTAPNTSPTHHHLSMQWQYL